MAVLTQKEFMEKLNTIIGDRTDDEALAFIEDCKDTISSDKDEWKTKYEEEVQKNADLEKSWREKYKARFFESDGLPGKDKDENNQKTNPASGKDDNPDEDEQKLEQAMHIKCDDLFKTAD